MGSFRGQKLKMGEICQTAGQIGTKFGTHRPYADSSENKHRLKNNYPLKTPGGILTLCGQKLRPGKCGQTASLIAG